MSLLPATVVVEDFAFHSEEAGTPPPHSTEQTFSSPPAPPLSNALAPDTHEYDFSSTIYDDYAASRSASAHEDECIAEEADLYHLDARHVAQSTRSSISSFSESVLSTLPHHRLSTPTKSPRHPSQADILHHGRSGSLSYKIKSPASRLRDGERHVPVEREYGSGFRNPSSVRAMQMRDDEFLDAELVTTPRHKRSGSRTSNISRHSANASPTKRSLRSNQSTPHKLLSPSKLKKEFPLVLLHCSLLPPTLALKTQITDEALMEEVLPAEYWGRWKILQDKIGEDNEVRTRGVLIPHPRDDYDVLEERLLESLELQRTRIRKGHYIGETTDVDSGVGTESERDTENESDVEGRSTNASARTSKCPDCGKRVATETEVDRNWEVKIYAANGLMRAGAWAAAWTEMEKVDVEVSVWMPEAVRREVDARLRELGMFDHEASHHENDGFSSAEEERRDAEIYGRSSHGQETIDGLADEYPRDVHSKDNQLNYGPCRDQLQPGPDLQTLIFNNIRGALRDWRNIFMALLSILVLFLAMSKPNAMKELADHQPPILSEQQNQVTMTSVSISTSTEVVTATVMATTTAVMMSDIHTLIPPSLASQAADVDESYTTTSTEQAEMEEASTDEQKAQSLNAGSDGLESLVVEQDELDLVEQAVQIHRNKSTAN